MFVTDNIYGELSMNLPPRDDVTRQVQEDRHRTSVEKITTSEQRYDPKIVYIKDELFEVNGEVNVDVN